VGRALLGDALSGEEGVVGFGGWLRGFVSSPSVGLPEVITCARGPLVFVVVVFRFLRPPGACDEASPRPTDGEDTQATTLVRWRAFGVEVCRAGMFLTCSGFLGALTGVRLYLHVANRRSVTFGCADRPGHSAPQSA